MKNGVNNKYTWTTRAAICGIFFGVVGIGFSTYQIWQSREDIYFQFRPYVNLKTVKLLPSGIQLEIENKGKSPAKGIMLGILDENEERLVYKLTSGMNLTMNDGSEETIIGLIGDLNPDTGKLLKTYFPIQDDFKKITKDEVRFIVEIEYSDYRSIGHDHKYYVKYNEKDSSFYISDEFETETGKERDIEFRKIF